MVEVPVEPQYQVCLDLRDQKGFARLGLMSNVVYETDPRRLGFMLARYKFVAKMLSGRGKVAELGCGDAFGSRIVLQEVAELHAYDIDPAFIADIEQRWDSHWPIPARVHDILTGPLPERYDAAYSLDVIEHIDASCEESYVRNLVRSLAPHGIVIIGSPSLESQTWASEPSKIGHVNCKSGKDLKGLLERFFHTVLLFSMNDEVVHTGFTPMAHYLIAVCCEPKEPS